MKVVFLIRSVEKTNRFLSDCLLADYNKIWIWGYFSVDFFILFYIAGVKCASNHPSKQNICMMYGKWELFNCGRSRKSFRVVHE